MDISLVIYPFAIWAGPIFLTITNKIDMSIYV